MTDRGTVEAARDPFTPLRAACAEVARRAQSVRIDEGALIRYATGTVAGAVRARRDAPVDLEAELADGDPAARAAFWLCLNAINFGSGWFPTLRKRPARSGYYVVAIGLRDWFAREGVPRPSVLAAIDAATVARILGQDRDHPLMTLFAVALRDLGARVAGRGGDGPGAFAATVMATGCTAAGIVDQLGRWPSFTDEARYQELRLPFCKRAQLAAADLHRSGAVTVAGIEQLTAFADNLVPHVLRTDGVLRLDPGLAAQIDAGELIAHGSPAEVELRACAVHAVELITAELGGPVAAEIDDALWTLGQGERYRRRRRHRTRCTAY